MACFRGCVEHHEVPRSRGLAQASTREQDASVAADRVLAVAGWGREGSPAAPACRLRVCRARSLMNVGLSDFVEISAC